MNHLLDIIICNSLKFSIEEELVSVLNVIPQNAFGVFITIHRNDLSNDKNYNDNVHGCIGNWNNNFETMTKDNIIKSIKQVSYKATWEDNRRNYFDTIYQKISPDIFFYNMKII